MWVPQGLVAFARMCAIAGPAGRLLCVALTVYTIVLFVKVIVSWLPLMGMRMPYSGPARKGLDLLDDVTEPALRPLRSLMPPIRIGGSGLDLSVFVLFIILWVARLALGC